VDRPRPSEIFRDGTLWESGSDREPFSLDLLFTQSGLSYA